MNYQVIEPTSTSKILLHDVEYQNLEQLIKEVGSYGFEISHIQNIKNSKRKIEWLSIRKLLQTQFDHSIDIIYNDQNRPFIKNSNLSISITHSYERIGIYLKESDPIGIDLQKLTDKVKRIRHKFLNLEEQKELNLNDTNALTIYWSLKEAAFKAYGINNIFLKDNIHILKCDMSKGEAICKVQKDIYDKNLNLRFELKDNYALAYVVNS